MPQAKFTVQLGKVDLKDVTVGAGSAEAQSETLSVNIDYTNLTKGGAMILLDEVKQKIFNSPWPPL
jgi:hypothetical protein